MMIQKQLVFFIYLLYYTCSGPASIRETYDKKKITLGKKLTKDFIIKYNI